MCGFSVVSVVLTQKNESSLIVVKVGVLTGWLAYREALVSFKQKVSPSVADGYDRNLRFVWSRPE